MPSLPGGFSSAEVAALGSRLDQVMARQVEEFGGSDRLSSIGDALTARCPLVYDDAFVALAAHATVLAICRELLGDYVILMQQNGVINPSGQRHTQVAYHRDLPYQHFVSSRPLAVSALFCIDPFTVRNRRDDDDSGIASDGAVSIGECGGGARHRGQRRARVVHRVRLDGVSPRG